MLYDIIYMWKLKKIIETRDYNEKETAHIQGTYKWLSAQRWKWGGARETQGIKGYKVLYIN